MLGLRSKFGRNLSASDVRNYSGYWATRRSALSIQHLANEIRIAVGKSIHDPTHPIEFLEFEAPRLLSLFEYEILPENSRRLGFFGDTKVIPLGKRKTQFLHILRLPIDIYDRARQHESGAMWMVAHELGHLFLDHLCVAQTEGKFDDAIFVKRQDYLTAEWQANEFAASFLMPAAGCVQLNPAEISNKYGVSPYLAGVRKQKLMSRATAA